MKKSITITLILLSLISAIYYINNNIYIYSLSQKKDTRSNFINKNLKDKYQNQVKFIASKPRNILYEKHLKDVENFIIKELTDQNQIINIQIYQEKKYKNIEAVINEHAKKTVVIGAHYDSYRHSLGADDNASSVVILLELAKKLKLNFKNSEIKIRLVFFTNEEPPFFKGPEMGSSKYALWLKTQKENVIAMYALDMLGVFHEEDGTQHYPLIFKPFFPSKGNFIAFIGNTKSNNLIEKSITVFHQNSSIPSQGLAAPTWISGIDFSDHLSFYYHDWEALMITDTAFHRNSNYHSEKDTFQTLNYEKMVLLTKDLESMYLTLFGNINNL